MQLESTVVVKLSFSNPNIYLISLVFSEFVRLSFTNEIDATHKEELSIRRVLH